MMGSTWRLGLCLALLLAVLGPGPGLMAQTETPETGQIVADPPLPESLTLCGEKVPLADRQVREMLDRELTIAVWDRAQVLMWIKRAGRYFPFIEERLAQAGLPSDLKYLAVAESSLLPGIRSNRSALGLWQFMADTAERQGIKANAEVDERLNVARSTEAALKYLTQLNGLFGSWTLALAAYNCGEGHVKRELEEQQVQSYYQLDLPNETERFVFRIAAVKIILENPRQYGYRVSPERVYQPIQADVLAVEPVAPVHLTRLAQALSSTYKTLRELNPEYQGRFLPAGKGRLAVPVGQGPPAQAFLEQWNKACRKKEEPPRAEAYVVKRGDTLSRISRETGVPVASIKELNSLSGAKVLVGQKLKLGR